MQLTHTHIDSFNRLSLGLIEKHGISPEDAMTKLESLHLSIACGASIAQSLPLQAALLTAVNTGKRAFLGGVSVKIPENIPCLLPWSSKKMLHEIVCELGAILVGSITSSNSSLLFGNDCSASENDLYVICNDWQGGILTTNDPQPFPSTGTIPTAGIFAGAFGVSCIFFKQAGIDITSCDHLSGISLWRPELNWLDNQSYGPAVQYLPNKYWILGLGHLGQAYAWHIGLLPYASNAQTNILLQDDDRIVPANQSAGLLADPAHEGIYKTRRCSDWLEKRGLNTHMTERRFDENTKRADEEPYVALCGFDSAKSRMHLENAGFDLIIEAGLGNNLATFDRIALHTFPNALKTPEEIWNNDDDPASEVNSAVLEVLGNLDSDEKCGIVSRTISGKAISASFVGACCGALVLSETLRGLHSGRRYDKIVLQLRNLANLHAVPHKNDGYGIEMGRNGFSAI